jgi:hypothetical protein
MSVIRQPTRGVVIKTVINGLTSMATNDPMRKAVA